MATVSPAAAGNNAASAINSSTSSGSTNPSGIDWNGLIEVAVMAKLARADSIDVKVTKNEAKLAAYQNMQSLLGDMMDAAQSLRAPSGFSNKDANVFLSRAAYLTGNGAVDVNASMSATIENGADVGKFDVKILELARAHKVAGSSQTSKTDDLGYTGVFSLGTVDGDSVNLTITPTMSLSDINTAINAQSATTGVTSNIVAVAGNQFRLVMSTVQTGQTIEVATVSGDDILGGLGILNAGGDWGDEVQESAQARVKVDDIEITRSSNDIDDILPGVTLHLYQLTPEDTSVTVEVGTNLNSVKEKVVALVDAYNAYRDFAYAQQQLPSDKNQETTLLFGDGTLRSANTDIGNALGNAIGGEAMFLLGMTLDNTNHLVLDEAKLDEALLADVAKVQSVLAFGVTASSPNVMLMDRGNEVVPPFTLDITVAGDGTISASVGGNSNLFVVKGGSITGAVGSIYEGYSIAFAGTASESINFSFTTGVAEMLYHAADNTSNSNSGTLTHVMDSLTQTNKDLTTKSETIRTLTETYRVNLTNRYAKVQAAIAQADSSFEYLKNLMDTWNNPS